MSKNPPTQRRDLKTTSKNKSKTGAKKNKKSVEVDLEIKV